MKTITLELGFLSGAIIKEIRNSQLKTWFFDIFYNTTSYYKPREKSIRIYIM